MRAIALILLSLAACGERREVAAERREAAQWKAAYSPAECKALIEKETFIQRCFGGDFPNGNYVGDLKCMPHSPSQRLKGVWVVDLEYSGFFPGASSFKDVDRQRVDIWLDAEPARSREITAAGQGAGLRAYAVEFMGRKSLCNDHYGHLGMSSQQVLMERMIKMRPLSVSAADVRYHPL